MTCIYLNSSFEIKKKWWFSIELFRTLSDKKAHNSTNNNKRCQDMSIFINVETFQRDFWVFQKFESTKFVRRKITPDFCKTRWQTLFWIWILFNHGRDSISISHHKVWSIAFWSLKFTGHLSILLDIFSTVFRQEDGAIWTLTQNLFPSFTMRLASMEPGKKTNLNKTPFSSLNWSSTRSKPWRRSVKWLFISSRLITWPCSSQKETVGVNLKTKNNKTKQAVCSILPVLQKLRVRDL